LSTATAPSRVSAGGLSRRAEALRRLAEPVRHDSGTCLFESRRDLI